MPFILAHPTKHYLLMQSTGISASPRAAICSEWIFFPFLMDSPTWNTHTQFCSYKLSSLKLTELSKQKQDFNGNSFRNLLACTDNGSIPNSIHDFISSADKLYLSVLVSEEKSESSWFEQCNSKITSWVKSYTELIFAPIREDLNWKVKTWQCVFKLTNSLLVSDQWNVY